MAESKVKSKAKEASPATKPRKSTAGSKSSPKAGVKSRAAVKARPAVRGAVGQPMEDQIRTLGGWRAETLLEVRRLIIKADPEMVEERKWIKPSNPLGVPVWSHAGIVCTGETYKQVVKLTFARGASLKDPARLFNSSLEGNTRRAIDIREGEKIDVAAFKALVQAAVAENLRASDPKAKSGPKTNVKAKPSAKAAKPVKLLSGGNPQIAKGDGDAPVQAYLAAIPGWKRETGKRLDALIVKTVPNVTKAVKWNSPFYGVEGQGWFLSFHVFTRYVKVTFFKGTSLKPTPPGGTSKEARWIDIHEGEAFDEARLTAWIKQAAAIPGWLA